MLLACSWNTANIPTKNTNETIDIHNEMKMEYSYMKYVDMRKTTKATTELMNVSNIFFRLYLICLRIIW